MKLLNKVLLLMVFQVPPPDVPALIVQLGSDVFKERESAHNALKKLGKAAWPLLVEAESNPNTEISARAKRLTVPFHDLRKEKLAAKLMPSTYQRLPWIWTKEEQYGNHQSWFAAAREIDPTVKDHAPDWTLWRAATRVYIHAMLREGKTEKEVVGLLDDMANAEINWIRQNRLNYSPPLELPGDAKPDF